MNEWTDGLLQTVYLYKYITYFASPMNIVVIVVVHNFLPFSDGLVGIKSKMRLLLVWNEAHF